MAAMAREVIKLGFSNRYKAFLLKYKKSLIVLAMLALAGMLKNFIDFANAPGQVEARAVVIALIAIVSLPLIYIALFRGRGGEIVLDDKGIEFNTAIVGFIDWSNLESFGRRTMLKTDVLGFTVKDLDKFGASAEALIKRNQPIRNVVGAMAKGHEQKIATFINPSAKYINVMLPVASMMLGTTPKSADLDWKGNCEWTHENYGCHFCLPEILVPDIDAVIARVSAHRLAATAE
jgi:hypothetical protein